MTDQAAGLRDWATQQAHTTRSLPVVGLPPHRRDDDCIAVLQRWQQQGKTWVGEAGQWQVRGVASVVTEIQSLLPSQTRWAVWVENDLDGFKRAYDALKALRQAQGPRQVLMLHTPIGSQRGLLSNLQQVAAQYLGMQLVLIAES